VNDPNLPERKGPPDKTAAAARIGDDANPYHMTDAFDIGEALERLAKYGDAVTLYPASGEIQMARIFSVSEETPDFVVELNEDINLPRGPITFVAWQQSAKLQFTLEADWACVPDQPKLLPCVFPEECLVLERRQATRLETPLGQYFMASFMIGAQDYELQLYDISIGGVGMRAMPKETVGLYVGRKLQRVRLELGPTKVIIVDLEIRLTRTFRSFLLGEQTQVGCSFINLTPALQADIKNFVEHLGGGRKLK
jgi:flagellar brake protein